MTAFDYRQSDDAFYVACARDGITLGPAHIAEAQRKAVEEAKHRDAAYVSLAVRGYIFHTPGMLLAQLKAVIAALDASFQPPPGGRHIVDIGTGDMILPVMDGPWAGHYLSWNPALGPEKHLRYPEPEGSHFIVGHSNGRYCWWPLKP